MLHEIPISPHRDRLLEVAAMQRALIEALCALPLGAGVDLNWLTVTWPQVTDMEWLRKFWENDSGNRAEWCQLIASAAPEVKQEIRDIMEEQLRFASLYDSPPGVRMTFRSWRINPRSSGTERQRQEALRAVRSLLEAFYDPLFYKSDGYPDADGSRFHKDKFAGRPRVCPYTDNIIQDSKLDHFLPKESFPFLSCHPDNLIPCSTDPNGLGRKGRRVPLDRNIEDQAGAWFHPRFRLAVGRYGLSFDEGGADGPAVRFVAISAEDQVRLDNMARMFGLVDFWSRDLDDELQLISGEVRDELHEDHQPVSEHAVRTSLSRKAGQKRRRIGHDAKAIVTAAFYEWILATPSLFAQVLRTCEGGT